MIKPTRNNKTYESGRVSALSSWPGTSIWINIDLSLISLIHGWLTKFSNDISIVKKL